MNVRVQYVYCTARYVPRTVPYYRYRYYGTGTHANVVSSGSHSHHLHRISEFDGDTRHTPCGIQRIDLEAANKLSDQAAFVPATCRYCLEKEETN